MTKINKQSKRREDIKKFFAWYETHGAFMENAEEVGVEKLMKIVSQIQDVVYETKCQILDDINGLKTKS